MLSHKEGTEFSGREAAFRGQGDSGGGVHTGEDRQEVAGRWTTGEEESREQDVRFARKMNQ